MHTLLLPMSDYAEALVGIHPGKGMQEWVNSALESLKRYFKKRNKMYAFSLDKHSARASMSSPEYDRHLLSGCSENAGTHSMIHRLVRWFMEPPDEAPPFAAAILDRFPVGAIFLIEGILKFRSPQEFGVGRFIRIGIPLPQFFAPFDGGFEIGCGALLLLGLFTRPAVIPMIINMFVAIYSTKVPLLAKEGFWKMAHAALLDYAMLFGLISILIAGAGTWSLDERLEYRWKDLLKYPRVLMK